MSRTCLIAGALALALLSGRGSQAQERLQPKVAPGPNEPDWSVILRDHYGLSMFGDLANPVRTKPEATPGLFRKAGPGPVTFAPVIALGLETRNRGGWYLPAADGHAGRPPGTDRAMDLRLQEHDRGPAHREEPPAAARRRRDDALRPGRPAVRPLGVQRRTG